MRKLIKRYKSAAAPLCQPGFAPAPGSKRIYGTPLLAAWWVRTAAKVHCVVRQRRGSDPPYNFPLSFSP